VKERGDIKIFHVLRLFCPFAPGRPSHSEYFKIKTEFFD